MNFSTPPTHAEQILRLIARVPIGRTLLEGFLELYRSGQVRIAPYPLEILERLRAALGPGQPIGACFVNDGETGTIHYDPNAPLGVLGPFLVHEMAHALDLNLWSAARLPQTRRARNELMLEAETRAFDLQHRFVQELRSADPDYTQFLETQQARVRVLDEKLTQQDIARLYGF